jgi:hypothetical protein
VSAELQVFSLVDHAHSTATELLDDVVMRDGSANHREATGAILGLPARSVNGRDRQKLAESDYALVSNLEPAPVHPRLNLRRC